MTGIIDSHFHIWRQTDLPWLLGPMKPRIFGNYQALKRDYPIAEYLADAQAQGVETAVYVQANWAPNSAVDEVAWVQAVAGRTGWPHGIVGYADFTVLDVRPALDRLKVYPLIRGVRQQLHWHENPQYRFAAQADLASDANFQRNIARLADYGWTFDLQVFAPQFANAGELVRSAPDVTFVLSHAGMPEDLSQDGRAFWAQELRALAKNPNIVVKLSGLGTFVHRNNPALIADIVAETIKSFGPKRCMFGSNFPIEKLWTSYADLVAAYQAATKDLSEAARRAIFHGTAQRIYRL